MKKMGVVVFGASVYDNHRELNNPRFANSIKEFKKIVSDLNITRGRETDILDLYNKSLLPNNVATQITDFIGKDYEDFIVYYCGHGDVGRREGDYRVLLRQSDRRRRHSTLLHIAGLIHDVQGALDRKRVYFVLDACYSGSAISEMETMDAGGAENLIDRSLSEAVEAGNGTAVLAASGRLAVAYARQEDKLTLFTGAFVRCLKEGIAHRSDLAALSWSDIRDEIVRTTRDRLGRDAPVPKLTSFSDAAVDITRTAFFLNRAYEPRKTPWDENPWSITEKTSEHLYWKNISEDSTASVLEDFLRQFPNGVFAALALALLLKRIGSSNETEIESHLRDYPKTKVKAQAVARLAALNWDRIRPSTNINEFEGFIAAFPEGEFADRAKDRIDAIRKEHAEIAAWWERIEKSDDPEEFDQFLKLYPDSRFSQLAKERYAEVLAERQAVSRRTGLIEAVLGKAGVARLKQNRRGAATAAVLVSLAGIAALIAIGGNTFSRTEADRTVLDAAGRERTRLAQMAEADRKALDAAVTDLGQLRRFVQQCIAASCMVAQEARGRLAKAEEGARLAQIAEADRKALDAAGTDLGQLRRFVQQCIATSCTLIQDARTRLANAEAIASRIAAERRELELAGENLVTLRTYLDRCSSKPCEFTREARDRLERVENLDVGSANFEVERLQSCVQSCRSGTAKTEALSKLAIIRNEETAFNSARGKPSALHTYLRDCKACKFRQVAQLEVAALTAPGPANFRTYANFDIDQHDIEILHNVSHGSCTSKCQSDARCVAYIFDKWKNSCYLKDSVGPLILDPRYDAEIRGDQPRPVLATLKTETCIYRESAIIGEVVRSLSFPSAAICRRECEGDQKCVAYTFLKASNRCSILSSTSDRTKKDSTSESGARMQNPC